MRDANEIPRSRNSDPETSHLAEKHIRETGKLNEQQMDVLRVVRFRPGETAREYQETNAVEGMFRRRLPELAALELIYRGLPRKCRVSRLKATTWWPTAQTG